MPTDDERREAAARLYEMIVSTNPTWPALMEVMGTHTRSGTLMEIVKLIEPEERTCRMTVLENARGNPKYFLMYVCSECHGAVVHTQNDPIYFCPNCGAKVVHDA